MELPSRLGEDPPTIPAVRADIKGLVSRVKVIVGNLTATAGVLQVGSSILYSFFTFE